MKLNIANPSMGLQTQIEVDDDRKLLPFFERRIGADVPGDSLGEPYIGTVFRITGGSDKQGFPMMQGVLAKHRVRLLFRDTTNKNSFIRASAPVSASVKLARGREISRLRKKHFRPKRKGQMKRKSIRGCIVGSDLSVLNLVLLKKGLQDIPGLTDSEVPRRLGPKRASNIRKLFNLRKDQDVKRFVIRRLIMRVSTGKQRTKAPKIQRLITKKEVQRKKRVLALKKRRTEASKKAAVDYKNLLDSLKK